MLRNERIFTAVPGVAVALFMIVSVAQSACSSGAPTEPLTDQSQDALTCGHGTTRVTVPGAGDSCCASNSDGSQTCTRIGAPFVGTACARPGQRIDSERSRIVKDTCVRESCTGDRDANPYVASADVEFGSLVCQWQGRNATWQWSGGSTGIRATQECVSYGPLYCGGYGGYGYGYGYGYGSTTTTTGYGGGGGGPVYRYVYANPIECTRNGIVVACDVGN